MRLLVGVWHRFGDRLQLTEHANVPLCAAKYRFHGNTLEAAHLALVLRRELRELLLCRIARVVVLVLPQMGDFFLENEKRCCFS